MNYSKNLKLSYKLSFSLLVLLLFGVILFHSCEKEGNHLKDTTPQRMVSQVSNYIMKFNSIEEYKKSQSEVLQMTFEELKLYEESKGFMSIGRAEEEFYNTIDPESFETIEELKVFVTENSKFIKLIEDENGEFEVVPLNEDNPDRYFMNSDAIFQIGDTAYKVLGKDIKVSSNVQNINELNKITLKNYNLNNSKKITIHHSNIKIYDDSNNSIMLKDGTYYCNDPRKLQTNGKNRTEVKAYFDMNNTAPGILEPVCYLQIKNQKRTIAWFNATRTTSYDLHIRIDYKPLGNPWYNRTEHVVASSQSIKVKTVATFNLPPCDIEPHIGAFDYWFKTPSISAGEKECNAHLF